MKYQLKPGADFSAMRKEIVEASVGQTSTAHTILKGIGESSDLEDTVTWSSYGEVFNWTFRFLGSPKVWRVVSGQKPTISFESFIEKYFEPIP